MPAKVKAVPKGYRTVTPYLAVQDAARAIEYYKRAFAAQELMRMQGPDGNISHAELKIGDSMIMLGGASDSALRTPQALGGTSVSIFLYVKDVDSIFKQALSAGAKEVQPVANMFWGDRYGRLADPFGHSWSLATHIEDVAPDEMARRAQEAMKAARRAQAAG